MSETQISLDVQEDIARALRDLAWLNPEEMANIVAHGLNRTMRTIRAEEKREMQEVFDNPTRFTLNSFFTVPATSNHLVVEIRLKENTRGVPPAQYLFPEVHGGGRKFKRFERALQAIGALPPEMYAVPGQDAPLDSFGNISGGFLRRILSRLRQSIHRDTLAPTGRRRRTPPATQVFAVMESTEGLPQGIYEKQGRNLKLLIKYVDKQPTYREKFDFYGIAETIAQRFLVNDIREIAVRANDRNRANTRSALSQSISELLRGN